MKIRAERLKKSMFKVTSDREWERLMQKMEAGEWKRLKVMVQVKKEILEIHNKGENFSKVFFGKKVTIDLNSTNLS